MKIKSTALSLVLALAMVFSTFAMVQTAYADTEEGTSGMILGSAVLGTSVNTADAQTLYYAGTAWRVIAYDTTGNQILQASDRMTLLSSGNLTTCLFNSSQTNGYIYYNSKLHQTINSYYEGTDSTEHFSTKEKKAVISRTLSAGSSAFSPDAPYTDLVQKTQVTEANLWPLSTKEACYTGVGSGNYSLYADTFRSNSTHWWLRSPGMLDFDAADVSKEGHIGWSGSIVDITGGVRPAFNFNLSSILLTSAAEGGKSSGTIGADALVSVAPNPPSENTGSKWKLTLKDYNTEGSVGTGHEGFTASRADSGNVLAGENIKINYSGGKTGTNEYVSVFLKDSTGKIVYYGHLAENSESATGAALTIPSDIALGTYTVGVFAEQCNGNNKTDYASAIRTFDITVVNHSHEFSYSADGPTITATCANGDGKCTLPVVDEKHIATLTITKPLHDTYGDGKSAEAGITDEYSIQGDAKVKYQKKTDDTYGEATETAPTDAGTYKASITLDGATAFVEYTIAQKPVTVTGITASNKVYDGNTAATLNVNSAAVSGIEGGDTVELSTTSATGAFSDKKAGNGKIVTITGLALTGTDASNYVLSSQPTTTANITKKTVTVTGITAENKAYDGNTNATANCEHAVINGKVENDDLSISEPAGSFSDKNVGEGKTVSFTGLALSGADAANYSLSGQPEDTTANITAKPVTITGVTAKDKVYDGDLTATAITASAAIDGIVDSENVSFVPGTGLFSDKNVGNNKTVSFSAFSLTGNDSANYTLASQPADTTAAITAKPVTVSGIKAGNKIYDGTTDATLDCTSASFDGRVGDDNLTVTATGAFADANAGQGKTVNITGLTLGGADKDNYVLAGSGQQDSTNANITAKEVGLTWTDTELTYNGKAQKPKATATGLVDGDECDVTVDGEQTDANAKSGVDKYTATAKSLNNSNYKLPENVTCDFTIAPKPLTQSMISLDIDIFKYDGTVKGPQVTMTDKGIMVKDEDYILSGDLSSSELGTHVITAEGKGNYTGSIETSWMMYSKKSNDQKEEGTGGKGDFEVFVDVENNSSDLAVDNLTVSMAKGFLTEEDMARYNAGENVLVYMIIKEQPKSETGAGDRYILDQLFRETGATDISWYDITVWKKIGNSAAVQVHDTIDELSMSVEVPDGQKNAPEGYTREFYMGRSHDGVASLLAKTSEVKVGFGSSKFSTYALAYKDTKNPVDPDDPGKGGNGGSGNGKGGSSKGGTKTGDPNDLAGLIALMLASGGALGAMGYRRRRENQR